MEQVSRDQRLMVLGDPHWQRKRKDVISFWGVFHAALQESNVFHVEFTKAIIFSLFCHQCSCSIHSKGETPFTQSQSQHSASLALLFYNHTITIFMRTPADGKTLSLSPPAPPSLPTSLSLSHVLLCFSFFSVGLF